jgi:selenocysteine-specific elongation factor
MPVVGTAGHVDHGKSTLVEALTGRDPDRFEEEKRRGLTIDIGFAWLTLGGGTEVSFVDVPGHERFMKNMLAGVEAIDLALFVVAADEGWKAQSEEHLAVLDLLDVTTGVIALTKSDRVDEETIELARLEVEEKLSGTGLEGSPIVAVSALTGFGLAALAEELEEAAGRVAPPTGSRPRLWVDRSFTVSGAGTIVTGTLLGGPLQVGASVAVWPAQPGAKVKAARVRGLESHETTVDQAFPGRRVANNLAGVGSGEVRRGAMVGISSQWRPTRRFLATLRLPRYLPEMPARGSFHLHLGSGAWPVRLRQIDPGVALVELPAALCLQTGDRFILRDTGRRMVVAGGRVLDPSPARRSAAWRETARTLLPTLDATPDAIAQALLEIRRSERASTLAAHSGGGHPRDCVEAGEVLLLPAEADRLTGEMVQVVEAFHAEAPLRPGVSMAELATRLNLTPGVVEVLSARDHRLRLEQGLVSRQGHSPPRPADQAPEWLAAKAQLEEAGLTPPRLNELSLDPEMVAALVRAGTLVKISSDLAYLPEAIDRLRAIVEQMPAGFSVSDFREAAGFTRKYAVPFLEWADGQGWTIRVGDQRTARLSRDQNV